MGESLKGKKIAILATNGFEQSELFEPKKALDQAGAETHVISNAEGSIKGWNEGNWGDSIDVDKQISQAEASEYHGLLLPGGVLSPDTLRQEESAIEFVKSFFKEHKPVAAICHGPQLLIEAGVVDRRSLTSYGSVKTDLINAGAVWKDEAVVVDAGLVTSRSPDDLESFIPKMIEEFAEGKHKGQTA